MTDYTGTTGPDTWFGTGGADTAHGGGDDDRLFGQGGDDTLYGEAGNDFLVGGPGSDLLDGGEGNDILGIFHDMFAGSDLSAGDQFAGGSGTDTLLLGGSFTTFDITGLSVAADIEQITSNEVVTRLTVAQLLQFQRIEGNFRLAGSGSFDLTGNRMVSGSLYLEAGADTVNLAGNQPGAAHYLVSGGGGDDQVYGSEGIELLNGDEGDDRLEGRGGADDISGGDGNDIVLGGSGNDTLRDGAGNDYLHGGDDDDIVYLDFTAGTSGSDQVAGGDGSDSLYITSGHFATIDFSLLNIADDFETLLATSARIVASAERVSHFQRFEALGLKVTTAGNFTLSSQFKVSDIELSDAGNGIDLTAGGPANYRVIGGAGNDTITGSAHLDTLSGGGGNDVIHAGIGPDEIGGGTGIDWVDGGVGNDTLRIEEGEGVSAGDRFTGGAGADVLFLAGQTHGSQVAITDLTAATIDADIEKIDGDNLTGARLGLAQLAGFGTIQLQEIHLATAGSLDLSAKDIQIGYLYLAAGDNIVTLSAQRIGEVIGGAGRDVVTGAGAEDLIRGQGGDDFLSGGGGSDLLIGGEGNDILIGGGNTIADGTANALYGGTGNDVFYVSYGSDNVVEAAGEGNDRVAASVSFALGATSEVEQLEAINSADTSALDLTGSDTANQVIGNAGVNFLRGEGGNDQLIGLAGNDFLTGGTGADLMYGGTGDDSFYVDNIGDRAYENGGEGTDRIATLISYTLEDSSEVELLESTNTTDTNAMDLTGSSSANTIIGNAGVNFLYGAGGNDTLVGLNGNDFLIGGTGADFMYGGAGDDTYYVDNLGDQASEAAGEGTDRIATSISYALIAGSEIELLESVNSTDTIAMDLTGSDSANQIIGNNGVNILRGEGGNDTLIAYGGDDYLIGGTGNDTMFGGAGDDTFYVDAAGDVVNESAGQGGHDRVAASASYTLAADAHVEILEAVNRADTNAMDLTGNAINNGIVGNDGANTLDGKGGNDVLVGFAGADMFAFTTALGSGNVDHITDFVSGTDKIALDDAVFTGLGLGALPAGAFVLGTQAGDADDRIIYDAATGNLLFDADGNGSGAAVLFATLDTHPPLAAGDIIVI